ncbi:MAG: hypothetical protein QME16_08130, partial [Planctomycetota bacterium]|nr:hypothetical protein [Planctomycetota bacterium]
YMAPFSGYLLIKKLLSKEKIDRLERNYGQVQIRKIIREILLQNYPFYLKTRKLQPPHDPEGSLGKNPEGQMNTD